MYRFQNRAGEENFDLARTTTFTNFSGPLGARMPLGRLRR